jgi:hypothetical protein
MIDTVNLCRHGFLGKGKFQDIVPLENILIPFSIEENKKLMEPASPEQKSHGCYEE